MQAYPFCFWSPYPPILIDTLYLASPFFENFNNLSITLHCLKVTCQNHCIKNALFEILSPQILDQYSTACVFILGGEQTITRWIIPLHDSSYIKKVTTQTKSNAFIDNYPDIYESMHKSKFITSL